MPIELYYPLSPRGKTYLREDLDKMPFAAVKECQKMISFLEEHGRACYLAKPLKHRKEPPTVWELKSRARGGPKGGARVYFFWYDGGVVLCGAESKESSKADRALIERVASIYKGVEI